MHCTVLQLPYLFLQGLLGWLTQKSHVSDPKGNNKREEKKKSSVLFSLSTFSAYLDKHNEYRMVRKTQSINALVTSSHTLLTQSSGIPVLVTETFKGGQYKVLTTGLMLQISCQTKTVGATQKTSFVEEIM